MDSNNLNLKQDCEYSHNWAQESLMNVGLLLAVCRGIGIWKLCFLRIFQLEKMSGSRKVYQF